MECEIIEIEKKLEDWVKFFISVEDFPLLNSDFSTGKFSPSGISESWNGKQFLKSIWESIEFLLQFYSLQLLRIQHVACKAIVLSREGWKMVKWCISWALTSKIEFKWTFHSMESGGKKCWTSQGLKAFSRFFFCSIFHSFDSIDGSGRRKALNEKHF